MDVKHTQVITHLMNYVLLEEHNTLHLSMTATLR